MSEAIGVFFSFTTYGTHLHGADDGSVSRHCRIWKSPVLPANESWQAQARRFMAEPEFTLDRQDRLTVLNSVIQACECRRWHLFSLHVRTTHVHAIVQTDVVPERALIYMKARATFAMKQRHARRERFWSKHGSIRYLWDRKSLAAAVDYVVNRQGRPMEWWATKERV